MPSVADKLLLAAYELEKSGRKPFSAEDLVVTAWKMFPDVFGLSGYRGEDGRLSFPDSNRVLAEVMGSKPIRKRGLLIKVGTKMYELTEAGHEQARRIQESGASSAAPKAALGRDTEEKLKRLLESKAVEKVFNNRVQDLTFYDACSFWGITPMSSAIQFQGQKAKLESIVASARSVLHGDSATLGHRGYLFGSQDLDKLLEVHKLLLRRFQPEIDVILQRKDERRV